MPIKPTKSNVARQYRDKYGMEMPTRKLARIMYSENNLLFTNYEDARRILGMIEGKRQSKNRKPFIDPELSKYAKKERSVTPYKLPESFAENIEPFIMPFHERVLVMNDIHLPYHDIPALDAALKWGKKQKPDAIFLNGDIIDCYELSQFDKDPKQRKFFQELESLEEFIALLKKVFNCPIYFKFGNHELRYHRFLYRKAKELVGIEEFDLHAIIKKRADVITIENNRVVIINGLAHIHGHEFGRALFSPVNAARGLFLQAKASAVKGDCHATSVHTERDIHGKMMTTYSIGCLCGLTPEYAPLNKWNHGVAMQFNERDGRYRLDNRRIYNGKVI